MMLLVCSECHSILRVADSREVDRLLGATSEWYPDKYPCWVDGCSGVAKLEDKLPLERAGIYDVTGHEAFCALKGLGIPAEKECVPRAVEAALLGSPVKRVSVEQVPGANRSKVNFIELQDGTRLHFGSSAYGAIIYRITKPYSYVKGMDNAVNP